MWQGRGYEKDTFEKLSHAQLIKLLADLAHLDEVVVEGVVCELRVDRRLLLVLVQRCQIADDKLLVKSARSQIKGGISQSGSASLQQRRCTDIGTGVWIDS